MFVISGAATALSGLFAGFFFAFACAVTPGLRRVGDTEYVATFRAINAAVPGPAFGAVFFGAPVVTIASLAVAAAEGQFAKVAWRGAALVFLIAAIVVTMARNLPLNANLARHRGSASAARHEFERPWNRANALRTGFAVAALVLQLGATV